MINRSKIIYFTNIFFLIISMLLCVLLYAFSNSNGFVANAYNLYDNSDIVYSKSFMSSGSDDNAIIWTMMIFRIIFIAITLFHLKKQCFVFFIIPFFLDILFLCLISDTSNISKTIAVNPAFLFWLLSWIISFIICIFVFFKLNREIF